MLNINTSITLANGLAMPLLGLGVWRLAETETAEVVGWALESGYRLIDAASYYQNEAAVGLALRRAGRPREEIFVTSKVWNDSQGYEATLRSYGESLRRLGLEYLDLYLIHWPVGGPQLAADTWRALERLYRDGLARGIGVSNFSPALLESLFLTADVKPMLNQVELHPLMTQDELRRFCRRENIAVEAYAPLARGRCLEAPPIAASAERHGKTPAQIILRWQLQNNIVAIPKSARRERIVENAGLYDFELDEAEMAAIASLNRGQSVRSTEFPADESGYLII